MDSLRSAPAAAACGCWARCGCARAGGGAGRSRAAGGLRRAAAGPAAPWCAGCAAASGPAPRAGCCPAGRRCSRSGATAARCARRCCATRSAAAATWPARSPRCSPARCDGAAGPAAARAAAVWLVPAPSRPAAARARGGDHVLRSVPAGWPPTGPELRVARRARADPAGPRLGRARRRPARGQPRRPAAGAGRRAAAAGRAGAARRRRGDHRRHPAGLPDRAGRGRGARPIGRWCCVTRHAARGAPERVTVSPNGDRRPYRPDRIAAGRNGRFHQTLGLPSARALLSNRDRRYRARRHSEQPTGGSNRTDRATGVDIPPEQSATPTRR